MQDADSSYRPAALTDRGLVRANNEDAFGAVRFEHGGRAYRAWVVADGMGGGADGEVASALAVDALLGSLQDGEWTDPAQALGEAFRKANEAVHVRGTGGGTVAQSVMGTTVVAALLEEARGQFWLGNAGDSRAYLVQDGVAHQLTEDHSLVAEQVRLGDLTPAQARVADHRHIVTRAVGIEPEVEADVTGPLSLPAGALLLLASDGLHGMLEDGEIASICSRSGAGLDSVAAALVAAANGAGGKDNTTVLLAGLARPDSGMQAAPARPGHQQASTDGRRWWPWRRSRG